MRYFLSLFLLSSAALRTGEATYQFIQCAEEVGGGGGVDDPTFEVPVDVSPACCVGTQRLDIQNDYILGNASLTCEDAFTEKMNSETDYEFEQACTFSPVSATCSFDYNDVSCNNDVRDLCHQMGGIVVEFDLEMDCLASGMALRFIIANHATCISAACSDDEILEIYETGFAASIILGMGMNDDPDGCSSPEIKDFRADGKSLDEYQKPENNTPSGSGGNQPEYNTPSGGGGEQGSSHEGYQAGHVEEERESHGSANSSSMTDTASNTLYIFIAGMAFLVVVVVVVVVFVVFAAYSSKEKFDRSNMIELSTRDEGVFL